MTLKYTRILTVAALSTIIALGTVSLAAATSAPTVTSITPTSGTTAGGDTVTVTGTGFSGASAVDFGATAAASFTVASDTSITATSPAGTPGNADITVVTPSGTSTTNVSDQFMYVSPATTEAATGITSSDATLNAMNGTGAASDSSFWLSTSTFSTASPTLSSGVFSTPTLGPVAASASFSSLASAAAGIGTIQPNTKYYFAAWTNVDGTWQPGAVLNFTTNATSTPPATTTIPVISNVAVSATSTNSAMITWNTDVNSSSQVFYGTSSSYGSSSALDNTQTTTHSVMLTGLQEATLYHFNVASTDTAGTATSSDMVFDSSSTSSSTPLAVTGIDSTKTTATADGTFADGWQWVIHFVVPTNETFFSMKFADFTSGTSSSTIPAANNIEFWSPQSSNASSNSSALVETNNDYTGILDLTGDTSSTTAGRQIDVYVGVAVPSGTPTGTYSTTFGALSTTSATTTP